MRARSPGVTIARHAIAFSWLVLVPGATFPRALAAGPEITSVYTDFDSDKCPHRGGNGGGGLRQLDLPRLRRDRHPAQRRRPAHDRDLRHGRQRRRHRPVTVLPELQRRLQGPRRMADRKDHRRKERALRNHPQVERDDRRGQRKGGRSDTGDGPGARRHPTWAGRHLPRRLRRCACPSDANALARQIADEHARTFQCEKDEPIVP